MEVKDAMLKKVQSLLRKAAEVLKLDAEIRWIERKETRIKRALNREELKDEDGRKSNGHGENPQSSSDSERDGL